MVAEIEIGHLAIIHHQRAIKKLVFVLLSFGMIESNFDIHFTKVFHLSLIIFYLRLIDLQKDLNMLTPLV